VWLSNSDLMSYSACQLGPRASYCGCASPNRNHESLQRLKEFEEHKRSGSTAGNTHRALKATAAVEFDKAGIKL
jgi:hypothetical protein